VRRLDWLAAESMYAREAMIIGVNDDDVGALVCEKTVDEEAGEGGSKGDGIHACAWKYATITTKLT